MQVAAAQHSEDDDDYADMPHLLCGACDGVHSAGGWRYSSAHPLTIHNVCLCELFPRLHPLGTQSPATISIMLLDSNVPQRRTPPGRSARPP